MCGISGIWNLNGQSVDDTVLQQLNVSIAHRGPDGQGKEFFLENQLALAHRRLSILDLTDAGHQPMFSLDKRYCVVYNGEIYNFIELRKELRSKGYVFKTESDTEVLINAWDCWGMDAFDKFNGMWAFALWDNKEKSLLLCRDRFGIKPLYFIWSKNKYFSFCSETNGFGNFPGFEKIPDTELLRKTAIDPFYPDSVGKTIWKDIHMVLPGHCMKISLGTDEFPEQKRWYSIFDKTKKVTITYEKQVEEFKDLFFESLNLRLRSDVNIATALSGGVDSSAVFCSLAKIFNKNTEELRRPAEWQKAFIMCFPGESNDERDFAEQVIKYTKGQGEFVNIGSRISPEKVIASTKHLDSINTTPLITADGVYEEIYKHGYRISLDGHGADELMYGYRNSVYDVYNDALKFGNKTDAEEKAEVLCRMYLPADQSAKRESLKNEINSAFGLKNKFKKFVTNRGLNTSHAIEGNDNIWVSSFNNKSPEERVGFRDFFINPLPGILRNFDKSSMQFSVESRMPFMDYRLVEFVNSLPINSKLRNGMTKSILRDSMKGVMPESIRNRTYKVGFIANMSSWFAGDLKNWLNDTIQSSSFRESLYFDGKSVSAKFKQQIDSNQWDDSSANAIWYYLNVYLITQKNL